MLEAPRGAPRLEGAHPHWRSTLASTFYGFKVLLNSDRVPVFLFGFCTCLDQAVARFWMGLARSFLPGGLQALNQLDQSRLDEWKVWIWVEAFSLKPPILNEWTCLDHCKERPEALQG